MLYPATGTKQLGSKLRGPGKLGEGDNLGVESEPDDMQDTQGLSHSVVSSSSRSVLDCIRDLFTCTPTSLSSVEFEGALDQLPPPFHLAPPQHVEHSYALSRNMLPVPARGNYTASERMFLDLGTRNNWPQQQSRDVLAVLRHPNFHPEDLQPDLLRQVSF